MNGLFDLDRTMAPKLIKILYIIAVILVALGMIRGVVMGVRIMTHPPQRHDRAAGIVPPPGADAAAQANAAAAPATPADAGAAPAAPDATAPATPPQAGRAARAGRRGFGQRQFAMRDRRFGMRRRGMMGGMMMRRLGPTGAGIFRIVAALVRGIILIMILRVLSEIGRAVVSANERLGRLEAK